MQPPAKLRKQLAASPPRAKKGTVSKATTLRLPPALKELIQRDANERMESEAQWWRAAALLRLGIDTSKKTDH